MSYRKFQTYFFITLLTCSGILTLLVFQPYLTLLAFGGVLAIVSRPVYRGLLGWIRSETAAAFLTIVVIATVILVPTILFFALLANELGSSLASIKQLLDVNAVSAGIKHLLPVSMQSQVPGMTAGIAALFRQIASAISDNLVGFFSNVFEVFFGAVVTLISAYYFIKDGSKIKRELMAISPLADEHDELVLGKVINAVGAVMNGLLIVGLIKGITSSLFFWVFGVPAPLFWGAMCGFASLVPVFGSGIITIPAVAYLALSGHPVAAIGLAVAAIGIIGTIDNLLQPKLVQSKTQIHPLLILLSILGGLKFFGFSGFVLGPLTVAVLMALIDIYKKEFRSYMERVDDEEGS
ncbi:MAG: hypothetical protein RLZZ324_1128 [Candidatus Parcubacteria bacterium]|jgi:predicted PurR-regulated permease PerM